MKVSDYHNASSGIGPLADLWADKPYKLVYDLYAALDRSHSYMAGMSVDKIMESSDFDILSRVADCDNCSVCSDYVDCKRCRYCIGCIGCISCISCTECIDCVGLDGKQYMIGSRQFDYLTYYATLELREG